MNDSDHRASPLRAGICLLTPVCGVARAVDRHRAEQVLCCQRCLPTRAQSDHSMLLQRAKQVDVANAWTEEERQARLGGGAAPRPHAECRILLPPA